MEMKEWKEYKLNDICTVVSSKRIFAEQYVNEGIPFYRQKEIIELHSKQPISEPLYISNEVFSEMKKKTGVPKKGDILLTAVGVTLGIPFLVNNEEFYFKDGNLIWLKNFSENIDSSFLYYWLDSKFGWESIYMRAIGSAQPALTIDLVKKYKMLFPPLPTQQKIASILSAYDNLIQNYKKQIEALQTAASELYKEWFVRFRFPGWQTAKFENGIPKGWKVEKIGEYCNIRIGGDVPEENSEIKDEKHKYPIFSNGINEDGLYGFTDTFKISEPSVTISARGTVGFVCLRREPYYPIVRLICLIPRKDLGVFYLYHSLKYVDLDGNGTSQQQLTAPMVSKRKIVIAEEKIIEKFNLNAKIIYNKIDLLKIQITNLTQQRDLLLPRLMRGALKVH